MSLLACFVIRHDLKQSIHLFVKCKLFACFKYILFLFLLFAKVFLIKSHTRENHKPFPRDTSGGAVFFDCEHCRYSLGLFSMKTSVL